MDCLVSNIGDSLGYSSIHLMYRAYGMTNAEINAGTIGTYTGFPRYFWRRAHVSGSGVTVCCNYAYSGTRLSGFMDSDPFNVAWRAALDELAVNRGANRRHILYIGFGTNYGPNTPSTWLAMMETCIADRKAAGWDDIVIQTIPSRTDAGFWGGAAGTGNTNYAAPINAILRDTAPGNWASVNGVYIADIAAHAEIGPWDLIGNVLATPSQNATHFYDTVHPTRATVEIALPTIQTAINARITAVGGTIIPTTA
jgi:hypothetical protein